MQTKARNYLRYICRLAECITRWLVAVAWLLCIAGCTSQPREPLIDREIGPDQVLTGRPIIGDDAASLATIDTHYILAIDDDIRQFIDKFVDRQDSHYLKLQQLLDAIITDGSFGLEYEQSTRTATDTFAARSGNCLSFTNMFIAMAREVGLDASYQEVDIPPDWSMRGDTYLLNRHVNVRVDLDRRGQRIVDFNIGDFKSTYRRREISDERAYAHFFSNKGVEQMQAGNNIAAFRFFRAALESDRGFSPGWSNLAALYNRAGEHAFAEVAYLEALRLQPDDLLAMSNLARLYESQGNEELAGYYRNRVKYHRDQNPYYRYSLARQAFQARRFDEAIKHLEYAVRKKEWEDSFYFLLGLSYLQKGDEKLARKWLDKAEEVAKTDALKRNYQSKIDLLLSVQ